MHDLIRSLREFNAEREWERFHSPKNLAMAILVEAAEVAEHFRWVTEEQSYDLPPEVLAQVRDEMGDVLLCLVNLADKLGIEPLEAAREKLAKNRQNYPADQSRGRASKHTRYRAK